MTPPPSTGPVETVVVDGLAIAREIRKELGEAVGLHVARGRRTPKVAVVQVGRDPASASFTKGKQRACARVGMHSTEITLPASIAQGELLGVVDELNRDDEVDGILIQLPLPADFDTGVITRAIDPTKDVDGLHPTNVGRLLQGAPGHVACTPLGVMEILHRYDIPLEGSEAVVIGRSDVVGKPLSVLLQQANATVTLCHSRTRDLADLCRRADLIVAAAGVPLLVKRDWVKPGAVVIDVGVTEVDGVLTGDVDTEGVHGVARLVTPHRRGVGPMTTTMLLRNTLRAYEQRTRA